MPRAELSKNSKYYIPAYLYKECVYFCLQYPEWVKELRAAPDVKGVRYDRERVQTSREKDATADAAMRRYAIQKKKDLVDDTIAEAVPEGLRAWVLQGVTSTVSVWALIARGMPCEKKTYYKYRRIFFYELSKKR